MTNTNGSLVTKFLEILDRQDYPAALELIAPNARIRVGGQDLDRDGWRTFGTAFYEAFPDGAHKVHRLIEAGDQVTVIGSFGGTHRGALMGIPATGRAITMDLLMVYRIANGRIVEHTGQFDSAGLMQQLAGPTPQLVPLATEWYRRIDAQRIDQVLELADDKMTFDMSGKQLDRAAYTGMVAMFFGAFPDGHHVNDELVQIGTDRVLAKGRFLGTHRGPFQGVAASGKHVEVGYMSLVTFTQGKVHHIDAQIDAAGLMQQLGA